MGLKGLQLFLRGSFCPGECFSEIEDFVGLVFIHIHDVIGSADARRI